VNQPRHRSADPDIVAVLKKINYGKCPAMSDIHECGNGLSCP